MGDIDCDVTPFSWSGGSSDNGSSDNNSEEIGNLGEKLDKIYSTSGSQR